MVIATCARSRPLRVAEPLSAVGMKARVSRKGVVVEEDLWRA